MHKSPAMGVATKVDTSAKVAMLSWQNRHAVAIVWN